MWPVFKDACAGQIVAEMNVHRGSRAAGWSSGWKWNSSICKVGGGRGGRPIDSSFGEGGGGHLGGSSLVGRHQHPPPLQPNALDHQPAVLQC